MKALTASLLAALLGCGTAATHNESLPHPPGTFLITADQIQRSGAHTAWQVLRQNAPMLLTEEDQNGRPSRLGRRGRASLMLNDAPMIVLDEARVPDFRALDSIEAESIRTILIYDGVEGTTYYGTDAVSGVIVIRTKNGQS